MNDKAITVNDIDHEITELTGSIQMHLFKIADMQAEVSRMTTRITKLNRQRSLMTSDKLKAQAEVY